MPIIFGWILLAVMVIIDLGTSIYTRIQRAASGQQNTRIGLLIFRTIALVVIGIGFVSFLNLEGGANPAVISLRVVP